MAKIVRAVQNLFGSTAGANQIAKFGSLAAGTPLTYSGTTADPVVIQSLSQFLAGWNSAVIGANSPAIEDMNALFFLIFRQLAYIFQAGVPEWDSATIYYTGSMVNVSGTLYISLIDNNLNNATSDITKWKVQNANQTNVSTTYAVALTDDYVRGDTTAGTFVITLPTIASSVGKVFKFKNVGYNSLTLKANGSETMDGVNDSTLLPANPLGVQYGTMSVVNNGTTWDIY